MKELFVRICLAFVLLNILKVDAAFSTTAANTIPSFVPSARGANRKFLASPLFIGTGFSFNDGTQVLVSVQKPLGLILEQDDEQKDPLPIIVSDLDATGSAARAGVQVGDVLVAVQNTAVKEQSLEYALDIIGKAPRVVNLRFLRKSA